jgi:hypothetical protein
MFTRYIFADYEHDDDEHYTQDEHRIESTDLFDLRLFLGVGTSAEPPFLNVLFCALECEPLGVAADLCSCAVLVFGETCAEPVELFLCVL